jgi:FHS family L-fucose permease-like MFS transporter
MATVGVIAIALAFVVEIANFPAVASTRVASTDRTWPSFQLPLRLPAFRLSVLAQFLALFAQVTVSGYALRYSLLVMPSWTVQMAHDWLIWAMVAFVAGRFVGAVLMFRVEPIRLLMVFSAVALLSSMTTLFGSGIIGVYGLIATSFFMAIQFPTIFAHSIRDLGDMAKTATSIIMLIAFGGTGVAGLTLYALTTHATRLAMIAPCLCCAGIVACAVVMRRAERGEAPKIAEQDAVSQSA